VPNKNAQRCIHCGVTVPFDSLGKCTSCGRRESDPVQTFAHVRLTEDDLRQYHLFLANNPREAQ